ncbi:MAG: hypothetical protein JNK58_06745 [Phycisphaerae bacterium]|nr:hypothetical protein [Phycisphaerae bacterium]
MKSDIGVWLDHSGAVLIHMQSGHAVAGERIASNIEPKRSSRRHEKRTSSTHRAPTRAKHDENRRREQIKAYYAGLARTLRDADRVLVIGPSVAKYELADALRRRKANAPRVVAVEACDRMTPRQLLRHVETFFAEHAPARPAAR